MSDQNAALRSPWPAVPGRSSLHLSHEQVVHYDRHGYLLVEDAFSPKEIRLIKQGVPELIAQRSERTVLEASGATVRSVYSIHRSSRTFAHLGNHPRMVAPARHLLDSDVYTYQSKLNTKAIFDGDAWPWHQDYIYWREEDGMPAPRALTAAVFLDEVTELNGPMLVIPGSHHEGTLGFASYQGRPQGYEDGPEWIANVVARMKYTIDKDTFVALARDNGVVAIKGRAGSVLFFDCNLAHASSPNLSPFERTLALFTYNRCDNAPPASALRRPDFLVERDTRPIIPESDHVLRAVVSRAP